MPAQTIYSSTDTPIPILDDAVTTDSIIVPDNQTISSLDVAIAVQHPRISDLVFHLISPDGTRDLLVENRGGTDPNGMGATLTTSNFAAQTFSGGATPPTANIIYPATSSGTLQISYNFFSLPDELAIFYPDGTTNFDSGLISGSGLFSIPYTNAPLTFVMNPYGNSGGPGDAWTYTVNTLQTNQYTYLVLTEDTNKTTTPIKFAMPPFSGAATNSTTNSASVWYNSFDNSPSAYNLYSQGTYFCGGWHVDSGDIEVVTNGGWYGSTPFGANHYFMDLNGSQSGTISTNIPTLPGQTYTLSFAYARNPNSPPTIPSAEILINGNPLGTVIANQLNSWANLQWQTTSFVFTATAPLTKLTFQSQSPSASGVFLDAVGLVNVQDLYYLPEQPLDLYDGLNAQGAWTLEIQDDRAGATNPTPELLSWQLRFLYTTTGMSPNGIPPGSPQTTVIPAGSWAYYPVNVPTNADYATNILVSATGPLNMWFNPNNNPVGNPGAGDVELLALATTGSSSTLSTFSVPTNIVPGGVYYIGLTNPNPFAVTAVFQVDFHLITQIIPLPPGVPITASVLGTVAGDGMTYFSVTVPPDADYATNLLLSSTAAGEHVVQSEQGAGGLVTAGLPPDQQRDQWRCHPQRHQRAAARARRDLLFGHPRHQSPPPRLSRWNTISISTPP